MSFMFEGCKLLETLNLTNFDTSKVKTMQEMFRGCSALTSLDLTLFNTSNVTNMRFIFSGSANINEIKVKNTFVIPNGENIGTYGQNALNYVD